VDGGQCETASGFVHHSSFILHHLSFNIHPSSFILHPSRRGISLMEVLISIFVLSIGLLGVAAIIPLGQLALWETAKADRSGACGRAAMREIEVGRWLDFRFWYWTPGPTITGKYWGFPPPYQTATAIEDSFYLVSGCTDAMPFVVDPLGRAKGLPESFGQTTTGVFLPRRTLRSAPLSPTATPGPILDALAEQAFFWSDDLPFDAPKNSSARPTLVSATSTGDYSWFFTVMPAASEARIDYTTTPPTVIPLPVAQRRLFNVSVAVCYKRNFLSDSMYTLDGEHTATISASTGFPGMGIGGGTVQLNNQVNVQENQWVMLYNVDGATPQLNRCYWYRVVGVGKDANMLSLNGPDWEANLPAVLVVVPGVIGVYNTTVELDWDPIWTK
jgi:hypothetical protein